VGGVDNSVAENIHTAVLVVETLKILWLKMAHGQQGNASKYYKKSQRKKIPESSKSGKQKQVFIN